MRREAVDKIKDMFQIDISVDFREDFRQTDDENIITSESESEEKKPEPMVVDLRTR